jgi:hypothetical protein
MRLLCLDLATKVGWACHSPGSALPVSYGVIALPQTDDGDIGRFLARFRDWLGHAIEDMGPTEIMFESPILSKTTSIAALRKLYSLAGIAELVAWDYELPIREATLSAIRTHFIGVRWAPDEIKGPTIRRKWLKKKLIAECRARGFHVADDNDADALALLSYGISLKHHGFRLEAATAGAAA